MTMLSLASSLNGDYLQDLKPDWAGRKHKQLKETQEIIEDNFVISFLKSKGYKFVFMGSGFGISHSNRYADHDIKCGRIDEPIGRFIQSTLIRPFADRTSLIENDERERVLCMFSRLKDLNNIKGPKFVFAHITSPQWTFLFDANGAPINGNNLNTEQEKKAYVNQLTFIDTKLKSLVDELLINSKAAPIIILQSDHGPNFAFGRGYDLQNPPQEILREKMPIFNAYYLPDRVDHGLYRSITPVNTFRLIFNRYFGTDFPLLEDRSYFSTLEYPFIFTNVSSRVMSFEQ